MVLEAGCPVQVEGVLGAKRTDEGEVVVVVQLVTAGPAVTTTDATIEIKVFSYREAELQGQLRQLRLDIVVEDGCISGAVVFEFAKVVVTELDPQVLVDLVTGEDTGPHFVVILVFGGDAVALVDAVEVGPTQFGTAIPGIVLSGCLSVGRKQA
ncbi:hypothetical protein D3C85_1124640 [compost metagenome]